MIALLLLLAAACPQTVMQGQVALSGQITCGTALPGAVTPTPNPAGGTYTSAQSVTLTTSAGPVICWNTAGAPATNHSTGCTTGTLYSGAITVSSSETLYYVAGGTGYTDSAVGSATYTINYPQADTPTFSPSAGAVPTPTTVTVSTATSACSSYLYLGTTDPPTTNTATYSVTTAVTLYAYVHGCPGYVDSTVSSAAYTISQVATPSFSPIGGIYASPQTVTISTTTGGASLYYTTDSSTPTCSSTPYTAPLTVSTSETIKAIGCLTGYLNSNVGTAAYTISSGSATLILTPNANQTGNYANSGPVSPSSTSYTIFSGCAGTNPCLVFGKQGTGTSSMPLQVSFNNCSDTAVLSGACSGTGSDTVSSAVISGTYAADFVLSGTATGTLVSGASLTPSITFTPTASAGTQETATLTVTDTAGTHTMSLVGTSATVTTLSSSSCPSTLAASTNYQLTANISCPETAFEFSGTGIDLNLNGYTLTFSTSASDVQIAALLDTGYGGNINVHNGTLAWGAGWNSYQNFDFPQSGIITGTESNQGDGLVVNNVTFIIPNNSSGPVYGQSVSWNGGFELINSLIEDERVGSCADVGCRANANSVDIVSQNTDSDTAATLYFDNVQIGGPQGAAALDNDGALVEYNNIYQGSATGNNTNDFSFLVYGANQTVEYNLISYPLQSYSNNRGIIISGAACTSCTNKLVEYNTVQSVETPTNYEYGNPGCQLGGTYGIQFDDDPPGTNIAEHNNVISYAKSCPAQASRITQSEQPDDISQYNTYTALHQTGFTTCNYTDSWQDAQPGCAYGIGLDGPTGWTSNNDIFQGDDADLFLEGAGAQNVTINSPTFNKNSTATSSFLWLVSQNGPPGCGDATNCVVSDFYINDPTFNNGINPLQFSIPAQGSNSGAASVLLQYTQTMQVNKASGPAASGAVVTWTDTLGNNYTCTTNSSGACSIALPEYRLNNDTGASQVEARNPYSLSVPFSGCTTYTQSGISITATASRPITLSGC
jgi:Chitobiase/beta-hexosaminidase C-terminal domain